MQLSHGAVYTLHALVHLARAEPGKDVTSDLIAEAERVPETFLRTLLRRLVAACIVQSSRGSAGGFRLLRPPEQLTLLEILEVIDGPLTVCGSERGGGDPFAARKLQRVCDHVTEAVRRLLGNVSLRDLAGGRAEKEARG